MELNNPSSGQSDQGGASAGLPAQYFWAKTVKDANRLEFPGISVRDHCLNVGCVAEALIASLPPTVRALLPPGATTLAALHDVGKISPGFQQKCPAWLAKHPLPSQIFEPDHAKISQWFLQTWIGANGYKLRKWLAAVGAHHGQSKVDPNFWIRTYSHRYPGVKIGDCGGAEWDAARTVLVDELRHFFCSDGKQPELPTIPPDEITWLSQIGFLAGLRSLAKIS